MLLISTFLISKISPQKNKRLNMVIVPLHVYFYYFEEWNKDSYWSVWVPLCSNMFTILPAFYFIFGVSTALLASVGKICPHSLSWQLFTRLEVRGSCQLKHSEIKIFTSVCLFRRSCIASHLVKIISMTPTFSQYYI